MNEEPLDSPAITKESTIKPSNVAYAVVSCISVLGTIAITISIPLHISSDFIRNIYLSEYRMALLQSFFYIIGTLLLDVSFNYKKMSQSQQRGTWLANTIIWAIVSPIIIFFLSILIILMRGVIILCLWAVASLLISVEGYEHLFLSNLYILLVTSLVGYCFYYYHQTQA